MSLLYPQLEWKRLPLLAGLTLLGALVAGLYGAVHDQVTYSLGPEYFTKLKFSQFHWADGGFPPRVFVSEIGFLASWWVGLIAGWLVARLAIQADTGKQACRRALAAYAIIFGCAVLTAGGAFAWSLIQREHLSDPAWTDIARQLNLTDLPGFYSVWCIHLGSYLGSGGGTLLALIYLWRTKAAARSAQALVD